MKRPSSNLSEKKEAPSTSRDLTSIRKGPCHPYVLKGTLKTIFMHCLLASSVSVSIHRGNVWFNLMFKELAKLPFILWSYTRFRCGGSRWWCWCNIAPWCRLELGIQPHVSQNLTDAFLNILREIWVTFQKRAYKVSIFKKHKPTACWIRVRTQKEILNVLISERTVINEVIPWNLDVILEEEIDNILDTLSIGDSF